MIRLACYVYQTDKAIWLAEHCIDKGYKATINLRALSTAMKRDLDEAFEDVTKLKVILNYSGIFLIEGAIPELKKYFQLSISEK